ncbi:MAG: type III-D CRISPR-associated protein Csx19 [Candidatus Thorarchaeota archaeon]
MEVMGCSIEEINDIEDIVKLIVEGKVPTNIVENSTKWLLVHQDDGVVWGLRENDGWKLSSKVFPNVSPTLSLARIQQLRVFGDNEELFVWLDSDQLKGRLVKDMLDDDHPKRAEKIDETFILLGDRVLQPTSDGFTLVGNANGSRQAIPIPCTNDELRGRNLVLSLAVRHFLIQDSETGCMRIALTRLVGISKEGRK